ncbi:hypothetical protein Tco_1249386, partial [Tanacetum coccineum]
DQINFIDLPLNSLMRAVKIGLHTKHCCPLRILWEVAFTGTMIFYFITGYILLANHGVKIEDLTRVLSHPQCEHILTRLRVAREAVDDIAGAARAVKKRIGRDQLPYTKRGSRTCCSGANLSNKAWDYKYAIFVQFGSFLHDQIHVSKDYFVVVKQLIYAYKYSLSNQSISTKRGESNKKEGYGLK